MHWPTQWGSKLHDCGPEHINTLMGFAMDHGCSYTSMGKGMHGKDLDADMNIVHHYKAYPAE